MLIEYEHLSIYQSLVGVLEGLSLLKEARFLTEYVQTRFLLSLIWLAGVLSAVLSSSLIGCVEGISVTRAPPR